MDSPKSSAKQASYVSVEKAVKLKNLRNNEYRDCLHPLLQALDSPHIGVQSVNGTDCKSSQESIKYRKSGNTLYSKKEHDNSDHKMILHFYTKSIAYAPQDSEELALGYSNRSVLWLHVKKYDLCLADIDRALNNTKCDDLKTKLLNRKDTCLQLRRNTKPDHKKLSLPTFLPSKLVSCAADSIELVYTKEYGRHYIATRDIKPGQVIMIENSSYINVKNDQIYLICSHCLAFAWAGIPCEFCVFTIYCSEACRKEAWQQYHDTMCSKIPLVQAAAKGASKKIVSILSVMLTSTRIINTFIKRDGIKSVLMEAEEIDTIKTGSSLEKQELSKFNCKKFKSVYSLAHCKIIDKKEPTTISTIRDKFTYIFNTNAFGFVVVPLAADGDEPACECIDFQSCIKNNCSNRGSIIGPCSSLMNHSCMPNVIQLFLPGPRIIMLSLSPVKKGEQLFICYGPIASQMYKEQRQHILRSNYFFDCECSACRLNLPDSRSCVTPTAAEERMIKCQLKKVFGKYADMIEGPVENWRFSEKLLEASARMCEFVHDRFDIWKGFLLSLQYKFYMQKCFLYLYSENTNDFPYSCDE